ncbi:sulfite reductase subunit alpha [Pusillimonas sp.]|uniref:sulfite reductase subunit alpha n=1 Tax=Pusillimonas sp. TaxID=3040095 RepID=UPI0037CBCA16
MFLNTILAFAAIAAWLLLAWHYMLRPSARRRRHAAHNHAAAAEGDSRTAIVYASQTGTAIEIARRTADAFGEQGVLLPMDELAPGHLANYHQALFIVSTYGEGDPPDMAQAFHQAMAQSPPGSLGLQGLQAGILALGDDDYQNFCGFGLTLDSWLRQQGATLMFDTLKANRTDAVTLSSWASRLAEWFQISLGAETPFHAWTLAKRTIVNPSGLGRPCHELLWQPAGPQQLDWSAGDIAQIQVGESGENREYSIASIPSEGVLRLLVREHQGPDGTPGLGSGWLCGNLAVGKPAPLRIRPNPLFRAPNDGRPAIFIGNGTGIAGLRSLLQERIQGGHHENWLIFGERSRGGDFHWSEILEDWLRQGRLRRLDLAFSRDQAEKRYVHHLLRESADDVIAWAGRGAVFFVCGSKDGMAQDVDEALRAILGPHGYEDLLRRHGYRRDVY